jgi:pre-mRNA-splicing factor ATP-dependent RNA helicase DHX38/PRP16
LSYPAGDPRPDWCDRHFLQAKGLRKAKEVRQQLLDIMTQRKIVLSSVGNEWDIVRKAICSAYFQNAAKFKVRPSWATIVLTCVMACMQ